VLLRGNQTEFGRITPTTKNKNGGKKATLGL